MVKTIIVGISSPEWRAIVAFPSVLLNRKGTIKHNIPLPPGRTRSLTQQYAGHSAFSVQGDERTKMVQEVVSKAFF